MTIFNQFISLWIAFNAYYISATNTDSDREAIEELKENKCLLDWYKSIKSSQEVSDLFSQTPIQNMKRSNYVIMNKEDFSSVLDIIYQIRNNLFHGNKGDFVKRDIEVITTTTPVLYKLVSYCRDNFDKIEF